VVLYDLKKDEIPALVEKLLDFTTANMTEQRSIARDFVKELTRKHRTAQQLLVKLFSVIIEEYSKSNSDPRNRAAVLWAKEVSKINNDFPFV
jgi:ribosomal protein L17